MIQGLLLLIALTQLACGSASARELPEIDFDRIVFMSSWTKSGKLLFSNGEYREPVGPGLATELIVKLNDRRAFGKLDGKEAGAVIVVTDPGGSGSFYGLALLVKEPQGWVNQEVVFLGDRIKIHSLALVNDGITVDMTNHGPADAMCCPTRHVVQRYALRENRLVKASEEVRGNVDPVLVDTVWRWQQTIYNNDRKVVPLNPENYTLKLLPDGKVSIRADCNLGGGVYTLRGNEIFIEITHTTRAACPPESRELDYIRDLNAVARYFVEGDILQIELKVDTGTMRFTR